MNDELLTLDKARQLRAQIHSLDSSMFAPSVLYSVADGDPIGALEIMQVKP